MVFTGWPEHEISRQLSGNGIAPSLGRRSWLKVQYEPSRPNELAINSLTLALYPRVTDEIELEIFLDGLVVEVFANR